MILIPSDVSTHSPRRKESPFPTIPYSLQIWIIWAWGMKEEGNCPKCNALSEELGGFRGTGRILRQVGSISWESFRQREDRALERGED